MKRFTVTYKREIKEVVEIEAETEILARLKVLEYDYEDVPVEVDCLNMEIINVQEVK